MKLLAVVTILFFTYFPATSQEIFKRELLLMGSDFGITVVANNKEEADLYLDTAVGEIQRLEKIISSWDPNSQTSEVNRMAGIQPVKVSPELFNLIQQSLQISELTDGAFDISYASMDKIWKFDGSLTQMPSKEEIKNSVRLVGYKNVILNPEDSTVFLKQKGMKIGFGAIGKGYAADLTKNKLQHMGAKAGIINASGDMCTWGKQPNGDDWMVAITNPKDKHKSFALLPIKGSVATSGDYEKFVKFNGVRYAHIIDPRTGYPTHGILSVTIFSPSAELCDALATSVFVMGIEIGLDRINQLPNIECIIVDENGKLHFSNNIQIETHEISN